MQDVVNSGQLLSDKLILRVLRQRMRSSADNGVHRFLLDGFPRTEGQARALEGIAEVQLAVNLDLREEVLVEKCLGRRMCSKCGGNFNVANIHYPAEDGKAEIIMPPLDPPSDCVKYMEQRDDDTMETILRRLEIYKASAKPVEDYYEKKGILCNYEITGGIPETMPVLMEHVLEKSGVIADGYYPEKSAAVESVGVSPA
jgi:adenylate kinase